MNTTTSTTTSTASPAVSLRLAGLDDAQVVRDLAALDDAPTPAGQVLLALADGEAVAALSLADGHVVANPFVRTAAVVALLRMRAQHIGGAQPRRRRSPVLRPRLV